MVNSSIKEVNFYEIAEQVYIAVEAEELRKIRAELEELKTD